MLCLMCRTIKYSASYYRQGRQLLVMFQRAVMHRKVIRHFFRFFLPYLQVQDNGLLSSRNYITMATWPNYFFSL